MSALSPNHLLLPIPKTFIYHIINNLNIEADVYLPSVKFQTSPRPIFLNIHGGSWIAGTRKEINSPLVLELLDRGFVVTSIDYRLLPEASIDEQFDDIKSAEQWVRNALSVKLRDLGYEAAEEKVIVGGNSAGAHLAMMVPHLWQQPPLAILALYGPTDFTTLKPQQSLLDELADTPRLSPDVAEAAVFKDGAHTSTGFFGDEPDDSPRSLLAMELYRNGCMGEFIVAGFADAFELYEAGSLGERAVGKISPALLPLDTYPPLYHIIGDADELFPVSQATEFAAKLGAAGVPTGTLIVTGAAHEFDTVGTIGGEVHRNVIVPALDFVSQTLIERGKILPKGVVSIALPTDAFVSS